MIIKWTGSGIKMCPVIGSGIKTTGTIMLHPGNNEVNKDDWAMARQHCLNEINSGDPKGEIIDTVNSTIEVKEELIEVDIIDPTTNQQVIDARTQKVRTEKKKVNKVTITVKEFKKLKLEEAEAIVKETFALETLKKWEKKESRDSVRAEIKNQIEIVETYHEDKKKKLQNKDKKK